MIVDVHCGGGRWLIAMAKRFPGTRLVGVEFETDSVARARAHVEEAGLVGPDHDRARRSGLGRPRGRDDPRLLPVRAPPARRSGLGDRFGLAGASDPGGWLVALDWYLPTDPDELRTRHAELIAGVQLDEMIQGTRLVTRSEALGWFANAGVPAPSLIDLPSGATVIVAQRA